MTTDEAVRTATGTAVRTDPTVTVHSATRTLTPPHARGAQTGIPATAFSGDPLKTSTAQGYLNSGTQGSGLDRTPSVKGSGLPPTLRPRAGRGGGVPDADEQHVLERALGGALRELRAEARMTQKLLARRAGISYRSLQDLEAGRRRPSPALLVAMATGSTMRIPPMPLDPEPVREHLVAAAGSSLVVDTPGGVRRRRRRLRDARQQYTRDLDAWWAGECAAAQRAEIAFVTAITILDRPGALDDSNALAAAIQQMDVFSAWNRQDRRFQPPWGTTSEFYKMARRHGYPMRRRGRAT